MARDDRIEAVIKNWAPRFISNGVPLADYQEVTDGLETWDGWCRAWSARAAEHEARGRQSLEDRNFLTAGQQLETAGVLYHFAKFVFVNDMEQMKAAHAKAVECRGAALPHLDPPGERVAIPYETSQPYGIVRKPARLSNAPVGLLCMGMGSATA